MASEAFELRRWSRSAPKSPHPDCALRSATTARISRRRDAAFPPGNGGYGLRNIRERLQGISGKLPA